MDIIDKSLMSGRLKPYINDNKFTKILKDRLYFYYKQVK
jgi:hypothetical protein